MAKRTRTPDWSIAFDDAAPLRSIVDAVSSVMQNVNFKVRKEDGVTVLCVDGHDPGMNCFVTARLELDRVSVNNEEHEFEFCINVEHLRTAIDTNMCTHGSLAIEGFDDLVNVRVHEPDVHTHDEITSLRTFVVGEEKRNLLDLDFDMVLEIDLAKLKDLFRKARKWNVERLRITVYLMERGAKQCSLVIFSISGDADHEQKFFHETRRGEDGSLLVRAAIDGGDDVFDREKHEPAFNALFTLKHIEYFVKTLPCKMINAKVLTDHPMMLEHRIGGDNNMSHVRFLIAPLNED